MCGYDGNGGCAFKAALFQQVKDRAIELADIAAMSGDEIGLFAESDKDSLRNQPVCMDEVKCSFHASQRKVLR